ncbi:hypothetical protein ColTof4_11838 [Colletotrichum tofieldiae]|uniref:Uncharacterized protein n=1 Tax=Colletotrichum liriopes TaxID=708192 RepID=A0AA37GB02_9PEZI|nr:hypothetical protein ColLi_00417 [Colletotrichum liriopes]GKT79415.1 hypothetical protein ColTof4_11838 [Colletotrichum tofieldiae]GKT82591.1 hypothetical protein Ct61P_00441 [Colletotrichum tofieldiae]
MQTAADWKGETGRLAVRATTTHVMLVAGSDLWRGNAPWEKAVRMHTPTEDKEGREGGQG